MDPLLPETCRVLRRTTPPPRNGMVSGEVISQVASGVRCRRDFTYMYQSRVDTMPDQNVSREIGTLFVGSTSTIQPNDIVVFSDGKQYDVYTAEPIWGLSSIHHYECEIRLKKNTVDI